MSNPERDWLLFYMASHEGRLVIPQHLGATMVVVDLYGDGLIVRGSDVGLPQGSSLYSLTLEGWAAAEALPRPRK